MGKTMTLIGGLLVLFGLVFTYGTHIAILAMGISQTMLINHAETNIVASMFITLGGILLIVSAMKK